MPWIPPCCFGAAEPFSHSIWGFWCHLPTQAPPEAALLGGRALRAVFFITAESGADRHIQTRSKSATATGESAHGTAPGSSRSVGPGIWCHPPPCQLPGTPGAQLKPPPGPSLLTVAFFIPQQTARLVPGRLGCVVLPARQRDSQEQKERAFSPKSCRGGQRNKQAN